MSLLGLALNAVLTTTSLLGAEPLPDRPPHLKMYIDSQVTPWFADLLFILDPRVSWE